MYVLPDVDQIRGRGDQGLGIADRGRKRVAGKLVWVWKKGQVDLFDIDGVPSIKI